MANEKKKIQTKTGLRLSQAQKAYLNKIASLDSSSRTFSSLVEQLKQQGKNLVRQTERIENRKFDDKFVDALEKGFNAIDRVMAHPRSFIKDEPEVVEAGLARKINSQSIVHLASHTNFVHSVDAKGNVTPEKILTIHAEVDMQIYENRFVMTLIKKCSIFIEKRYQYIKDHGETRDSDLLQLKTTNVIDGATYEVNSTIKVSTPSADEGNAEKNEHILSRLKSLRDRCSFYTRSPFMGMMAGAKDVANPIHMTNMLMKNPDYHGAYVLWQFIDKYLDLGVEYGVRETEQDFDDEYSDQIYKLLAASILTLHSHQVKNREIANLKKKEKAIRPKVTFTLEDETFYDGKFLYDQFPDAKRDEIKGVPSDLVDWKLEKEKDEEKIAEDRYKKGLLDDAIEKQKAIDIAQEAIERQKRLEEERLAAEEEARRQRKLEEERLAAEERARQEAEQKAREEEEARLQALRESILKQAAKDRGQDNGEETEPENPAPADAEPLVEEPLPTKSDTVAEGTKPAEEEKPVDVLPTEDKPKKVRKPRKKAEPKKEEEPKPEKKARKPRKKAEPKPEPIAEPEPIANAETEPIVKEEPIVEPTPVIEETKESEQAPEIIEEPVKEEGAPIEEKKEEAPKKKRSYKPRAKKAKVAPIEEAKPSEEEKPADVLPAKEESKKARKPRKKAEPKPEPIIEPEPIVTPEPEKAVAKEEPKKAPRKPRKKPEAKKEDSPKGETKARKPRKKAEPKEEPAVEPKPEPTPIKDEPKPKKKASKKAKKTPVQSDEQPKKKLSRKQKKALQRAEKPKKTEQLIFKSVKKGGKRTFAIAGKQSMASEEPSKNLMKKGKRR